MSTIIITALVSFLIYWTVGTILCYVAEDEHIALVWAVGLCGVLFELCEACFKKFKN